MIGIYKITNKINGKIYIGQSVHIERRWQEHCQESSTSIIAKAIKKYGKENFSFEVLEQYQVEDYDKLDEREMYYIHQYNSLVPNGYNVTEDTGVQHTTFITLTKEDFDNIVNLLQNTELPFEEIAQQFKVNRRTINRINNGYTHKRPELSYPIRINYSHGISPLFQNLKEEIKQNNKNYCIDCGKEIGKKATRCTKCDSIKQRVVKERPNREQLKQMIRTMPFTHIGEKYGVRDNTIRKWCKQVNLPTKSTIIKQYTDEEWELI